MTNSPTFDRIRRKRSGTVVLTTMAALGGGAMLSGCGEAEATPAAPSQTVASKGEEVAMFENVFTCAKETGKTREECADLRKEAAAIAAKEAPRFEALSDCEEQYGEGKCVAGAEEGTPGEEHHRRHFSPFIAGFIWGNSSSRPAPVYSSRGGGYQTSRGVRLSYAGAPGKYHAGSRPFEKSRSVPKVKAASSSAKAKAGGFGETSRSWALSSRSSGTSGARSMGG